MAAILFCNVEHKVFFYKRQRKTFPERRTSIKIANHNRVTVIRNVRNMQIFKVLTVEINQMQSRYTRNLISQILLVVSQSTV